ncbi:hypothetical protein MANES_04G077100v8 [Manihot esculenta]|uniref:Uncharacterized protein n=1 Tax=Manihot esculenta TaxID=3983 RepID=A0ACB7HUP4_MANES|nr:hypothetical protein MANES_04G077100v8 [Manihot esculenta]
MAMSTCVSPNGWERLTTVATKYKNNLPSSALTFWHHQRGPSTTTSSRCCSHLFSAFGAYRRPFGPATLLSGARLRYSLLATRYFWCSPSSPMVTRCSPLAENLAATLSNPLFVTVQKKRILIQQLIALPKVFMF